MLALHAAVDARPVDFAPEEPVGLVRYLPEDLDSIDYAPHGMEDAVANLRNRKRNEEARSQRGRARAFRTDAVENGPSSLCRPPDRSLRPAGGLDCSPGPPVRRGPIAGFARRDAPGRPLASSAGLEGARWIPLNLKELF